MKKIITSLLLIFIAIGLKAQLVNTDENSQSPAGLEKPTKDRYTNDVDLFTGTLNSNYSLGTVSTINGTGFNVNLSYSSSQTNGNSTPFLSGIPYGEGWNVVIPTISCTNKAFYKYTLDQLREIAEDPNLDPEFNYTEILKEGNLRAGDFNISIPGVASGKLVPTGVSLDEQWLTFHLNTASKYIEAKLSFTGVWKVYDDTGTEYHFSTAMINHRNPSNQRYEENAQVYNIPADFPNNWIETSAGQDTLTNPEMIDQYETKQKASNSFLPNSEITSWYITKIVDAKRNGFIQFEYDGERSYSYFELFRQPFLYADMTNFKQELARTYKNMIIKRIWSNVDEIKFNYEEVLLNNPEQNLLRSTDEGVEEVNDFYLQKKVWSMADETQDFYRYRHVKAHEINDNIHFANQTNPYLISSYKDQVTNATDYDGPDDTWSYYKEVVPSTGNLNEKAFDHGYLESPLIPLDALNYGEEYFLKSRITGNTGGYNTSTFDFNIVAGNYNSENDCTDESGIVSYVDNYRNRHHSLFSTFNDGAKWFNYWGPSEALNTKSTFNLGSFPNEYGGIRIQIGPGNSENIFTYDPAVENAANFMCMSYLDQQTQGTPPTGTIANNFGIGLPWFNMLHFYQGINELNPLAFCNTNVTPTPVWWLNTADQSNFTWSSRPTRADENIKIEQLELYRVSKRMYMLTSVERHIRNFEYDEQTGNAETTLVGKTMLDYELKQGERKVGIYDVDVPASGYDVSFENLNQKRNFVMLKSITEIGANETAGLGGGYQTSFDYEKINLSSTNNTQFVYAEETETFSSMHSITSDIYLLNRVTKPNGYEERYAFSKDVNGENQYLARLNLVGFIKDRDSEYDPHDKLLVTKRIANKYNYQYDFIVASKTINSNVEDLSWEYDFSGTVRKVNSHFVGAKYGRNQAFGASRYGFEEAVMHGPISGSGNGGVPKSIHRFYKDYFLFGMKKETLSYDSENNLVSKVENEYDVNLIAESAALKPNDIVSSEAFDYYPYKDAYSNQLGLPIGSRPTLGNILSYSETDAYNKAVLDYYYDNETLYNDWKDLEPTYPNLTEEYCVDDPTIPGYITGECTCKDLIGLGIMNEVDEALCQQYIDDFTFWIEDFDFTFFQDLQFTFSEYQNLMELPNVFKTKEFQHFLRQNHTSFKIHAYLTRLKKTKTTSFDHSMTNVGAFNSITAVKEYEYYDADYTGEVALDIYKDILSIDDYAGYDPLTDGLFFRPSFQLYSTKEYTEEFPENYTLTENFYFYDLVNNPLYHIDPYDESSRTILPGFKKLKRKLLFDLDKDRTEIYQTRITQSRNGASTTRNSFFDYQIGWDFDYTNFNVTVYNEDIDCSTLGDGTIFNGNINGCILWASSVLPSDFCRSTGPLPPTYICPCADGVGNIGGLTGDGDNSDGGNADQSNEPEPEEFISNELAQYSFLKNEYIQISEENANHIAPFHVGNGFGIDLSDFEVLKTREVLKRNLDGFVQEEQDVQGQVTRYTYPQVQIDWVYYCDDGDIRSYQHQYGNHKGYPEQIEILYQDELLDKVTFEYNLDNTMKKKTSFNNEVFSYEYDDYLRLSDSYMNSSLMEHMVYSNWTNDPNASYEDRIRANYIEKQSFVDAVQSLNTRQYFNHDGNVVGTTLNGNRVMNNSIFDQYGRVKVSKNPTLGDIIVNTDTAPINIEEDVSNVYEQYPRSRPIKTAANGVNENDQEILRYSYAMTTQAETMDLLSDFQSSHDLGDYLLGAMFSVTTILDEDNKKSIQISDASGKLVATLTHDNQLALIAYNQFGEVSKTQDALGYVNTFHYNYLGQIYKTVSVDEGESKVAYNERFLPIASQDGNGRIYLTKYDRQSKPIEIKQTELLNDNLFDEEGLQWLFTEDKSYYNDMYQHVDSKLSKQFSYGTNLTNPFGSGLNSDYLNSISKAKNRLVESISYDKDGTFVESEYFNYDEFGRIKWKLNHFNYENISHTYRTDYLDYTLSGIPRMVNMDISSDNILDAQYIYEYNDYFDLESIYFGYENTLLAGTEAMKIVDFRYDDQFRLAYKDLYSTEYVDANGERQACNEIRETVAYEYNSKQRMSSINSPHFSQELFYDDQEIGLFDANYNGNINSSKFSYNFIHDQANDKLGVTYNGHQFYQYDDNNRLINFRNQNGEIIWGRAQYEYDLAGNITSLDRYNIDENGIQVPSNYRYEYSTNNNHLEFVRNTNQQILKEFDHNGNGSVNYLVKNSYTIGEESNSSSTIQYDRQRLIDEVQSDFYNTKYLYNANDKRIFTKVENTLENKLNIQYYMNDGLGHDVAISNLSSGDLEWYVIGSERIAKISGNTVKGEQEVIPTFEGDPDPDPDNPWNGWDWQDPNPPNYPYDPDRGNHGWIYKSWSYSSPLPQFSLSSTNDLELQKSIRSHMSASTESLDKIFPNSFHPVHEKSSGNLVRYDRKVNPVLDTAIYEYRSSLEIRSLDQYIVYKNGNKKDIISVNDFVGVTPTGIPVPPNSGNDDPFNPLIPSHDNPPLLVPYWFLYDHLGNTRMTLNYDCLEEEFFVTFAADYFPYGKPIWEYELKEINGVPLEEALEEPRYISTQHERDQETDFDFRGARYYDSDVGMFLSVDPLAADFVAWSPYNYVMGNPIRFIDPDGKAPKDPPIKFSNKFVTNVLSGKEFSSYSDPVFVLGKIKEFKSPFVNNCWHAASRQVEYGGSRDYSSTKDRVDMYKLPSQENLIVDVQKGVDLIINNLNEGQSVVAGIEYGASTSNVNEATDHFINIVGYGKDKKGYYFSYYDNAIEGGESAGVNVQNNRLYYDPKTNLFKDEKAIHGESAILTEVRETYTKSSPPETINYGGFEEFNRSPKW